jgi:hypothetical protein
MGETTATDPAASSRPPLNGWQRGLVVLLFLGIEVPLFFGSGSAADVANFGDYARQWRATSLRSLYECEDQTVEYPPLAIGFIRAIDLLAERLPARGAFYDHFPDYREAPPYALAHRGVMALLILLILTALLWLLDRHFRHETRLERLERVAVFVVGVCCLAQVLFGRLDLVLGALILLAAMLAVNGRHWLPAAAVLAVGVAFKVTPVLLVPFWALATVPRAWLAELPAAAAWGRLGLGLALRGATVLALAVLLCLPFYLVGGPATLNFFRFHAERGIECETTYAAALAVLHQFGLEVGCRGAYGAYEVEAACTPLLSRLAPWVVGVPLLLALVAYGLRLRREARGAAVAGRLGLIGPLFLALLIFLLGNKVLSPQYFLWLLPLAPLMPLSGRARRWFLLGFALVCLSTFSVFPLADRALIGEEVSPGSPLLSGPNLAGALILSARSLALLALTVGLAIAIFRSGADRTPETGLAGQAAAPE